MLLKNLGGKTTKIFGVLIICLLTSLSQICFADEPLYIDDTGDSTFRYQAEGVYHGEYTSLAQLYKELRIGSREVDDKYSGSVKIYGNVGKFEYDSSGKRKSDSSCFYFDMGNIPIEVMVYFTFSEHGRKMVRWLNEGDEIYVEVGKVWKRGGKNGIVCYTIKPKEDMFYRLPRQGYRPR